mgnify:FL=1|jgi:hypothetical protein
MELKDLILTLINKKDWRENYNMVYYMYYNEDNPVITTRHSHKLLY